MLWGGSCATAKFLRAAGVCLAAAAQGTDAGVLCLPGRLSAGSSPGTEEHRVLGLGREVPWSPPVVALAATGAQDGQTGVPEVQGLLPTELLAPWNPGAGGTAPGCGGGRDWGKEQVWEMHIKGISCVCDKKRNNGPPQSALLFQWALPATQGEPTRMAHTLPSVFYSPRASLLLEQPQVLTPLVRAVHQGGAASWHTLTEGAALWVLWAGELRGTPGAPIP